MTDFIGTNYYQLFPGLQAREQKHTEDLQNLYNEFGYNGMDEYGYQTFDNERFFNDYWDMTKQENPAGIYARQNALLESYYNDLNTMGVRGVDGNPFSLNSNNLPVFQGQWFQSNAAGTMAFGAPDEHTYDYLGPSYVRGQEQLSYPINGGLTSYSPQAPYRNEKGLLSFARTAKSTPTFTGNQTPARSAPRLGGDNGLTLG